MHPSGGEPELVLDEQQQERVAREAGELRQVMEDFDEKAQEVQSKVDDLLLRLEQEKDARVGDGVSYLVAKQQMLLSYCLNLCVYLGRKLRGEGVADHAATWQLLELRGALERLRPLDARLKYQLDKLFRAAAAPASGGAAAPHPDAAEHAAAAAAAADPLSFRPNPDALVAKDGGGGGGDGDGAAQSDGDGEPRLGGYRAKAAARGRRGGADGSGGGGGGDSGAYRAPRMAAVPYEEDGAAGTRRRDERRVERRRDRARTGEILETLREEFGDRPEVVRGGGGSGMVNDQARRKLDREERERREFEEDHMIRLQRTKKMKRDRREATQAASRLDTIADVGNVGDFMRLGDDEEGGVGVRGRGPKSGSKRAVGGALGMAVGSLGRKHKKQRSSR
ncbi:hypothetical protein JKP88DRAFT_267213 [Tribonema minus]|uniref:Neuroguidin n=1 Tax=Tribonema minus TaxID=303371 RepID=A0A835ZC79_9STRA|nr:hypothetical protein JKP88DRAFT_268876 [Tribonema minus]KAG5189502.1 hypothetical protein JKP88DRAFT_267213 [Tribonema minus]